MCPYVPSSESSGCARTLRGLANLPKYSALRRRSSWQMSSAKPTTYTKLRCTTRRPCPKAASPIVRNLPHKHGVPEALLPPLRY